LLGYAPYMPRENPYKAMQKLAIIYGPVVGFFLGPKQPFISICGAKWVKEALHNNGLIGRPEIDLVKMRTFGEKLGNLQITLNVKYEKLKISILPSGLIFADGRLWQEQRRFTVRHLRDLGFGKTEIEDQMMDEVRDLLLDLKCYAESDSMGIVDFKDIFTVSVINILWLIVAGKRYSRDDPKFKQLLANLEILVKSVSVGRLAIPFPDFLLKFFPRLKKFIGIDTELFVPLQSFIQVH